MKLGIHPVVERANVVCSSCGNAFEMRSVSGSLTIEVCSACHPAYTGKTRSLFSSSRVERFERRYGRSLHSAVS